MTAVVIGVGNRYRGDDGAGPIVAELVERIGLPGISVVESDGEPTRVLDAWDGATLAIVVDAVRTGTASPGTVHRLEAPLPAGGPGSPSSHALGLGDAYALGQALGRLPGRLVVYGIEGRCFATGIGLSEPVAAAVRTVVGAVAAEIKGGPGTCA